MMPWYAAGGVEIRVGHVLDVLAALPAGSVQCCVTSPPYFGLRSYSTEPQVWGGSPDCDHAFTATNGAPVITGGLTPKQITNAGSYTGNSPSNKSTLRGNGHVGGGPKLHSDGAVGQYQAAATCTRCGAWKGELGSEAIPDCLAWARGQEPCSTCFVCHLVVVFRAVRRVLHDTGTVFCNLGDSYSGSGKGPTGHNGIGNQGQRQGFVDQRSDVPGLGPKQLLMMPARVALALQSDGWVLRSDIVWNKPNPMPESVTDRPTKSHEYIFLLSKSPRYFFDQEAVRERVGETAIVETPNLSHQALVLGQDLWTQEAATERSGLSVSTEDDHRSLFQRGIDLASAILERTQSQQQLSLTTFDTQVGQECASNGASARTIGNPVMRRATAQATRLTDGDISAKEFLREMDSLCIALPDGDDLKELWAHARATTSSTIPLIHANGDGPVTINDASEVGQLKLIHNEEYTMQDPHSSGRNIRSVWELPTESFKGSHFATFPRKLVEPCVLAGTSARGQCPACGAPWRRTTDITRTFESGSGRSGNLPVGKNGAHLQGGGATLDIRRGPVVHTQTTGWAPTCTCGIYRCLTCQYVVEYPSNGGIYDSERSNSTAPVQGMPGSAPGEAPSTTVLQSLVCEQGDIDGTEGAAPASLESAAASVPSMPNSVPHNQREYGAVQSELFWQVAPEPEPQRAGLVQDGSRLHHPVQAGVSGSNEGRVHHGAPLGDGAATRSTTDEGRGSPPSGWEQGEQCPRESTGDAEESARQPHAGDADPPSNMPIVPARVSSRRECPRCKAPLDWTPFPAEPQTVLDIFLGSGTTAYVARHHGRRAVGIELNESYARLAADRLRQGVLGLEV
jgi:hypothetical protein